MTGARVPLYPYALERGGVQIGRPARGGFAQWAPFAEQANHLLGRGGALVPWSCVGSDLSIGSSDTLRVMVAPRYQATHRVWASTLSTSGTGGRAFGTFTDPSGGTTDYSLGGTSVRTIRHVETISSRTVSETELAPTWTLDASSSKTARLVAWSVFEVPRPELATDTSDHGVSLQTLDPGAEILAGSTGRSVGAVAISTSAAESVSQRNGLFHFARDTKNRLTTTSAAYTRVFTLGADPVLLGRQLYIGESIRTVKVRCRAASGAGTTGNIRFTMTSGDSLVLPVTAAMSPTWLTGDLDVDCDDFSNDALGTRRTPGDKCLIEWQRTAGASTVRIESISIITG